MLFNYGLFKLYIKCQKTNFRNELICKGSSSLEEIEISTTDLYKNKKGVEWHENNKEIIINETFFEVIKVISKKDITVLQVVKDEKENKLFASYFNNKLINKDFLVQLIKIMCGLHLVNTCNYDFKFFENFKCLLNHVNHFNLGIELHLRLIKPPQSFSL